MSHLFLENIFQLLHIQATKTTIYSEICDMKYTSFFSTIVKEQGQPHLSNDQFRRMMNIVHLESYIDALYFLQKKEKHRRYEMLIFAKHRKLVENTGNLEPKLLMEEMVRFSRI